MTASPGFNSTHLQGIIGNYTNNTNGNKNSEIATVKNKYSKERKRVSRKITIWNKLWSTKEHEWYFRMKGHLRDLINGREKFNIYHKNSIMGQILEHTSISSYSQVYIRDGKLYIHSEQDNNTVVYWRVDYIDGRGVPRLQLCSDGKDGRLLTDSSWPLNDRIYARRLESRTKYFLGEVKEERFRQEIQVLKESIIDSVKTEVNFNDHVDEIKWYGARHTQEFMDNPKMSLVLNNLTAIDVKLIYSYTRGILAPIVREENH